MGECGNGWASAKRDEGRKERTNAVGRKGTFGSVGEKGGDNKGWTSHTFWCACGDKKHIVVFVYYILE